MLVDVADAAARVIVQDNGIGIERQTLATIFEPFRRDVRRGVAAHEGGLGLGLALSKGLVDLHGGRLIADSDGPGTGAKFVVTLPCIAAPVAAPAEPAAECPIRRRVLIVEDAQDLADSLRELLEGRGHQTAVVSDGQKALVAAREFLPEVVICDIGLPGDLDGYGVARKLRTDVRLSSAYLISLTGFASKEDKRLATEAGFDLHIAKPPQFKELERLVASCNGTVHADLVKESAPEGGHHESPRHHK